MQTTETADDRDQMLMVEHAVIAQGWHVLRVHRERAFVQFDRAVKIL